jgi:hypothetical protein
MTLTYRALRQLRAIGRTEADLRAVLMTRPIISNDLHHYQQGNLSVVVKGNQIVEVKCT